MDNNKIHWQAIFWDFDGVILNSMPIRDRGFATVLSDFPAVQIDELLKFHRANGGLSRYVKFRYFFETIRQETVTEVYVQLWAQRFSEQMRQLLTAPELLIAPIVDYIKDNYSHVPMYIVSGSDQDELRWLCNQHEIAQYFKSIYGSPTSKKVWLKQLLSEESYNPDKVVLIGDSKNDYEAANESGIHFLAYNNASLNTFNTTSWKLPFKDE